MSQSAFKYFTIQTGGVPQPLIGTWLTVAVTAAQIGAAFNSNTRTHSAMTLTVSDSSMFVGYNWLNVIDPTTFETERAMILAVPSSTTVQVQGLKSAHPGGVYGTGSWVALGAFAESVYVQGLDGNTGSLFIGTGPQMVTATGVLVLKKLVKVATATQPNEVLFSQSGLADSETLSQFWIDGTTGDSYLPSLGA